MLQRQGSKGSNCVVTGACTHVYHLHCIQQWVTRIQSFGCCPMCRKKWYVPGDPVPDHDDEDDEDNEVNRTLVVLQMADEDAAEQRAAERGGRMDEDAFSD